MGGTNTTSLIGRRVLFVESEGTLTEHETTMQRALQDAQSEHGRVGVESVSLSTTSTGEVVRYSSILVVQIG
jgi:hypothetical protein